MRFWSSRGVWITMYNAKSAQYEHFGLFCCHSLIFLRRFYHSCFIKYMCLYRLDCSLFPKWVFLLALLFLCIRILRNPAGVFAFWEIPLACSHFEFSYANRNLCKYELNVTLPTHYATARILYKCMYTCLARSLELPPKTRGLSAHSHIWSCVWRELSGSPRNQARFTIAMDIVLKMHFKHFQVDDGVYHRSANTTTRS